jgi:hypothetical protein
VPSHRSQLLLTFAVAFAATALAVLAFTHGGEDDTYITYWAAHALGEYGGILNYNGARVEQSSSLSLVLVLGLLHAVTRISVPWLGYFVGLAAFVGSLVLSARVLRGALGRHRWLTAAAVGTIPTYAYWATSGMETPLVAATGMWLLLQLCFVVHGRAGSRKRQAWLFAAALAFAASRPEAPFLTIGLTTVACGLGVLRHPKRLRRGVLPGGAAPAVAVFALLLFRKAYFGAWLPNPAMIKSGGFALEGGFLYFADAAAKHGPWITAGTLLAVTTMGPSQLRRGRAQPLLVWALALAYFAFVLASGGDWMRGARLFAFGAPAAALASLALFCRDGVGRGGGRAAARWAAALLIGSNLLLGVGFLRSGQFQGRSWSVAVRAAKKIRPHSAPDVPWIELANKVHGRDAVVAARLREIVPRAYEHLGRPVVLMSGQAGLIAYQTFADNYGKVRFLDQWNITNRELLDCLGTGPFRNSSTGTAHDLMKIFNGIAARPGACGLQTLPDIQFNERLRPHHKQALSAHDYVVVYHQTGTIKDPPGSWISSQFIADGYIAVRRELAEALGLKAARGAEWKLNP